MPATEAAQKRKAAKAKAKATEEKSIEIPKLQLQDVVVPIIGTSPLIVHRFSEKVKKEMLAKQMGAAKMKKAAKDPRRDFAESFYVMRGEFGERPEVYEDDDGIVRARAAGDAFAFPSLAFKSAMVGACRHVDGMTMTTSRGAFHVIGEFTEILYDEDPIMREDVVRVGPSKVADMRYRGQFTNWRAKLFVRFNSRSISLDQLVNLANIAGFSSGVGEWRPEKSGDKGVFQVDIEAFAKGG